MVKQTKEQKSILSLVKKDLDKMSIKERLALLKDKKKVQALIKKARENIPNETTRTN